MKIGTILDMSTVDYPGKPCSVIFTFGCNFRCRFCFNYELVIGDKCEEMNIDEILTKIIRNRDFIEGVCITGGEPTLQTDLEELCRKLKDKGLLVKLDTNGSNPEIVKNLIDDKLVDFIAMDFKSDFDHYSDVIGVEAPIDKIKQTMNMIIGSGVDYELRGPIVPGVNDFDFDKFIEDIKDSKIFVFEQFISERGVLDASLNNLKGLSREQMIEIGKRFKNPVVKIRSREGSEYNVKA